MSALFSAAAGVIAAGAIGVMLLAGEPGTTEPRIIGHDVGQPIKSGSNITLFPSPQIASSDVAEVCADDGLPGSAYARTHRVVRRHGVYGMQWDHRIPLCAGGADVDANIWLQPLAEARVKDRLESLVCRMVCRDHILSLSEAQAWFTGDWREQLWRLGR